MSKTDEQGTPRRLTNQEWAELRNEKNFSALFRSLHPNWTVTLERTRPSWCTGWLETVDCDPDDPIDQEYIRDTWGGQRFRCIINDDLGQYVTSFRISIDAPPKRAGKLLDDPEAVEARRRADERVLDMERARLNPAPAPGLDPGMVTLLGDILKTNNNASKSELEFLKSLIALQRPEEGRRDLKELLELAVSMREMAGMFGLQVPGGTVAPEPDMWAANAAKFLEILTQKNQIDQRRPAPSAAPAPSVPKARPVQIVQNLGALPPSRFPAAAPVPAPAAPSSPDVAAMPAGDPSSGANMSRAALASTLACMEPMDAATVVMATLSEMPQANREKLLEILGVDFGEEYDDGETLADDGEEQSEAS
jgi:hypothetical protein